MLRSRSGLRDYVAVTTRLAYYETAEWTYPLELREGAAGTETGRDET
jgi:hypothetical protein